MPGSKKFLAVSGSFARGLSRCHVGTIVVGSGQGRQNSTAHGGQRQLPRRARRASWATENNANCRPASNLQYNMSDEGDEAVPCGQDLPNVVLEKVFKQLDPEDLCRSSATCRCASLNDTSLRLNCHSPRTRSCEMSP